MDELDFLPERIHRQRARRRRLIRQGYLLALCAVGLIALAYLRQEAVRITESILFVKQHSVNCIGASIFYLQLAFPEFDEAQFSTP